jgi:Putative peptidoglycan binding domain
MRVVLPTCIAILLISSASPTLAHGGGLDASGCHHDRKHGGYHCHNGGGEPAPVRRTPVRAERDDNPRPLGLFSSPSLSSGYDAQVEISQKMLARLGYDTGTPDGKLGPRTEKAVTAFQASAGLPETGTVSMALIDALIEKLAE